ncbi:MAG: hypothetical protein R3B09_17360 [Nannocystaceae bacterium]
MPRAEAPVRSSSFRLHDLARAARRLGLAFVVGVGLAAACSGGEGEGDDEGCEMGTINCLCFPNLTCLAGLTCSGNLCVPPTGGSASTTGTTDGTGGSTAGTTGGSTAGTTGGTTAGTTGGTTAGTTAGTTDGTTGGTTSGTEDGGPVVVDFGTNVKAITEGESVIFTATLTDPDGPDDIQGGSLKSADEAVTYGAFNDLGNGTYELTLSWAAIDQAIGIEFTGTDSVDFKAVFFDNEGHKGFATTSISLNCGDEYAVIACDGHCVHADVDEDNCGTCGNACAQGVDCNFGSCEVEFGQCLLTAGTSYKSCAEYCGAQGEGCAAECDFGISVWVWSDVTSCNGDLYDFSTYDSACEDDYYFDPMYTKSIKCCCTVDAVWPAP